MSDGAIAAYWFDGTTVFHADGRVSMPTVTAADGTIYQYGFDGVTVTRPDGTVSFIEQNGGDE